MEFFSLLSNGKDLDTGIYDYFTFADKAVEDYRKTRQVVKAFKEGEITDDVDKYIYAKYCISSREDYLTTIDHAYNAFQIFKRFPLATRKKIFYDIYENLISKKEAFLKLLAIEGHPRILAEWEFEGMRIGSSPETIDYYFSQIRQEVGRHGSEVVYLSRRPDGVVCVSPPSNAAASNSFNAILSFITGNTVIIKPPLRTPLSTIFLWKEIIWDALKRNNVPDGVVNIVVGNSQQILDTWLKSEKVSDILFFGDSHKGLEIGKKIYEAGKKPILELSGNDLMLIWEDANIEAAANSLLDCFLGSTQICMVPKIALIHKDIYTKFRDVFVEKVKNLHFGLPSDPNTIFSPVGKIKEFYTYLNDALSKGAKLIIGGERVNHEGLSDASGIYLQPTLIEIPAIEKADEMLCFKEEIFFPLLPLVIVSGTNEEIFNKMTNLMNAHNFGLRTSLWVSSYTYLRKFAKTLDNCGLLRINMRHTGFSYLLSTHGGTRRSGGPYGEMNYFWQKTSHLQGVSRQVENE